jgi:hypothetical protein
MRIFHKSLYWYLKNYFKALTFSPLAETWGGKETERHFVDQFICAIISSHCDCDESGSLHKEL